MLTVHKCKRMYTDVLFSHHNYIETYYKYGYVEWVIGKAGTLFVYWRHLLDDIDNRLCCSIRIVLAYLGKKYIIVSYYIV